MDGALLRNFAIIAHVDHGKSTLADRLLELTHAVDPRSMKAQYLDNMELERERGITIKAQTVRLPYKARDGTTYTLNLIDTPGHVDFSYEVSRSLSACEGVLLVVDAAQGVEAQTLANVYQAIEADLAIVPVVNKIDLPGADPAAVLQQLEEGVGIEVDNAVLCSAKTGEGVDEVIEAVVRHVPPPAISKDAPLKALVLDSWFDSYVGVVTLVRVVDGDLVKGSRCVFMQTGTPFVVQRVGAFTPKMTDFEALGAGEVGFLISGLKAIQDIKIGDTVTLAKEGAAEALPGFREVKPMVYSGIYPVDPGAYEDLRDALGKLTLNDSAIHFEPESSEALGFGFRCGFLGMLHMEVVQERLEREYDLGLIVTAPVVVYRALTKVGEVVEIHRPNDLPPVQKLEGVDEPLARCAIHTPDTYVGAVMKLCTERRGIQVKMEYLAPGRVVLVYDMPFAEVIFDFFDRLKSVTRGYASLDYELQGYQRADLVKLDILVNTIPVDALSIIVHRDAAYRKGVAVCRKIKEFTPRQQFDVAIQAAMGSRVIARTTQKAYRKNVTAKCYGGDVTRKRKLLEKQKAGKRRMKAVGKVELPQEAFLAVLSTDDRER
jgi:GTP-binding protein LepA